MSSVTEKFGWFEFQYHSDSEELLSITNYLTQQSLIIEKSEKIAPIKTDKQYTATYRDEDFSQSVVFSIRAFGSKKKSTEYFNAFLDYNNSYDEEPSYSHWRRLDIFICDALLCWQPQNISQLKITGGWFAGKWCNRTIRWYGVINGLLRNRQYNSDIPAYLPPLDDSCSQDWHLVDFDNKPDTGKPKYELDCECSGQVILYKIT